MPPNDCKPLTSDLSNRMMAHYLEIVSDRFEEDDPRRESIALELYDIAAASDLEQAMDIISFWEIPDSLAERLVVSIRSTFSADIRGTAA